MMKSEAKECTCQQIPHLSPCITPMSTHRVVLAFSGAVMLLYVLCSIYYCIYKAPRLLAGWGLGGTSRAVTTALAMC